MLVSVSMEESPEVKVVKPDAELADTNGETQRLKLKQKRSLDVCPMIFIINLCHIMICRDLPYKNQRNF